MISAIPSVVAELESAPRFPVISPSPPEPCKPCTHGPFTTWMVSAGARNLELMARERLTEVAAPASVCLTLGTGGPLGSI